jgi:heme A synthase
MEDKLLKLVYTFFLGLILALFVGMGIGTFYTAPVMPEYPQIMTPAVDQSKESPEMTQVQRDYDEQYKKFDKNSQIYHRNVSIISLIAAVTLLIISLLLERKNNVITNGVMLGGVFVLIYSIGQGIASTDTKYTFIGVSISLAVVLYLGYRRFGDASAVKTKPVVKNRKK